MELKELAKKVGVENILITHSNSMYYKDSFTIIINKDLVMNYVGKTYTFIPLTINGVGKALSKKNVSAILSEIRKELKEVKI